jgi:hypothetical protein
MWNSVSALIGTGLFRNLKIILQQSQIKYYLLLDVSVDSA